MKNKKFAKKERVRYDSRHIIKKIKNIVETDKEETIVEFVYPDKIRQLMNDKHLQDFFLDIIK